MNKNEIKSKWWYRLIKVVFYVTLILVTLGGSALIWSENQPYTYTSVDNSKSYIQCNKDKKENLVYYFDKSTLFVDYSTYNDLADYSKTRAKELCSQLTPDQELLVSQEGTRLIENGVWNVSERIALINKYKTKLVGDTDYTVHISKEVKERGGYLIMIKFELCLILVILLLAYLIASTFKYVVFGEKFGNPFRSRRN